ncbi:MAG: cobalt ECF transporter T component CbiQ [Eubacterium sp.]|nr:cobalt ECF transporter T component CbiQ [Eubacterium sp.]
MFAHGLWKGRKKHHHFHIGHSHGGSTLGIDAFAYASKMRAWNAGFKVLLATVSLILCIAFNNIYVSVAVILMMGYLTIVIGELELDHYISMMTIPIVFMVVGAITIAIGYSFSPAGQYNLHVFNLFYIYCSDKSLIQAAVLILKALGAVSALYMMTLTTPLTELVSVLRKIHMPQLIVELMNMIYRYIFIMLETYTRLKNSAESRLGYCDFRTSCYSFGNIASNLFVVSLNKANAYYNALEARCYDGELNFLEDVKPVRSWQIVFGISFICALCLIWFVTR